MSRWVRAAEECIKVDRATCTGCGCCLIICGGDVFEMRDGKACAAHVTDCLECGNCEIACPAGAITFEVPPGGTGIIYECG